MEKKNDIFINLIYFHSKNNITKKTRKANKDFFSLGLNFINIIIVNKKKIKELNLNKCFLFYYCYSQLNVKISGIISI